MTADMAPPRAGAREWGGLAVLALATLAGAFDIFVLLLALPRLSAQLGASGTQQLWILDMYGFMLGGFLVTMGTLGDRIGRRKLLLIGAAGFAIASVLSAYSSSAGMLIATRALLGISGATLGPSTLSLISNMFRNEKQRAQAIGAWASCFTVGAIVGPILGGILLEHFWWGSVFLLGVPAMVLLLVLGPFLLPEYRAPDVGQIDIPSVALSLAAILPATYGIKQLAVYGWQWGAFAALAAGAAFSAVFLRRQRRLRDPLVDLGLFSSRDFRVTFVSLLLYSMLTGTTLVFMTQYFQSVDGMSTLKAALAMIPGLAVGTIGLSVAPVLGRRFRPSYLIAGGLVITVIGLVLLTLVGANSGPWGLMIGFAVWCLGGGPLLALGMNMMIGAAPPERAGSASSMVQITSEFGYAFGIALVGTIGTAVYRHVIMVPAGTPAGAASAARGNVANAVAAASRLPAALSDKVLAAARGAFSVGLHTVAGLSAVVLVGVAVYVAIRLRHIPAIGAAEPAVPAETTVAETAEAVAEPAVGSARP